MSTIIDSYSETNQSSFYYSDSRSNTLVGQSFENIISDVLDICKFYLKKTGSPTGNATAKIYSGSSNVYNSYPETLLATSDNFDVSTLSTSYSLIQFTFSGVNKITLSDNTWYHVVFSYSGGDANNYVNVGFDSSSPSHSGVSGYGVDLVHYNINSGGDLCFYVYNTSTPSTSPSISPSSSISASLSPSTSASISSSLSTSQSPSTSISQSPSLSPSISISISPSLSSSQSSSMSPSLSESLSPSSSISASLSPSTSESISPSISESISPSTSISQSPSISISVSPSASPSQPETTSLLIDYWNIDFLGSTSPSISPSLSPSLSESISPSVSESISPSLSESISASLSPSISESSSISASVSPSLSESISPSLSESISASQSSSLSPSLSPSVSSSISPSVSSSVSSSISPSISPSASPSPPPSRLLYKVYQEDGTFVGTLNDVVSDLSISKEINGGDGPFTITLARKIDDFGEGTDIDFNYRIKVYLFDDYNPTGKLMANGYVVSYEPYLNNDEEGLTITCLSAISKLSNDYYRLGTSAVASELGVELATMRADEMMTAVINHYRSVETNSMIGEPSGLTQTTDNAGNLFDFTLRLFNKKHLEALKEIARYFARYKSNGYWFYWRINTEGNLEVKNISQTATHKFTIGNHITSISGQKTIEGLVNRVYFWNEKGTTSSEYLKLTTDDTDSQDDYDIVSEYINDSSVTNVTAASLLSSARVYDNKDPKVKIKIELNSNYDLSSIEPGQTCQIFNLKNNPYKLGEDKVLFIHSITYEVDHATLEIAEAADDFTDMVEEERNRLTDELTWFGYISQDITAAQLGPADRTWSTNILFTASSDSDAYRKMTWTTGSVYLATSISSSAGKRVIAAGNTGTMTAGQDYYIYLNEDTINITASVELSGTGVIKQGEEYLYDTSKSWTTDQWQGYIVTIGGQTRVIRSNTATVLSLEENWTIADTTGTYNIRKWTFDVTNDKSAVASSSNVIFGTTRATTNTASQASIVTENASSTTNFNFDGTENIAERSITYLSIKANTITANEINTGAISIGLFGGSLDDVDNGSTYYKTTANQVTGASRGYTGLDSNGYVKIPVNSTKMSSGSAPSTGIFIDSTGIYGRYGGTTKFSLLTSDGSGYFAGELGSVLLTSGYIRTASSGQRIVLNGPANSLQFYDGSGGLSATLTGYTAAGVYGTGIQINGDIRAEENDLYISDIKLSARETGLSGWMDAVDYLLNWIVNNYD